MKWGILTKCDKINSLGTILNINVYRVQYSPAPALAAAVLGVEDDNGLLDLKPEFSDEDLEKYFHFSVKVADLDADMYIVQAQMIDSNAVVHNFQFDVNYETIIRELRNEEDKFERENSDGGDSWEALAPVPKLSEIIPSYHRITRGLNRWGETRKESWSSSFAQSLREYIAQVLILERSDAVGSNEAGAAVSPVLRNFVKRRFDAWVAARIGGD